MNNKLAKYSIHYDSETETISFSGKLRFTQTDPEFAEISELLKTVLKKDPPQITLNLEELEFLNSLGISMISKFIIKIRNKKSIHAIVKASHEISWQGKSLVNLQRIMPSLEFTWV